jgi:hypothetical protein
MSLLYLPLIDFIGPSLPNKPLISYYPGPGSLSLSIKLLISFACPRYLSLKKEFPVDSNMYPLFVVAGLFYFNDYPLYEVPNLYFGAEFFEI